MTSRRSTFVFLGAAAVLVVGFQTVPSLLKRSTGMPGFEPLSSPEGFRRLSGGRSSSAAFDLFVGLETAQEGPSAETIAEVEANLCKALFPEAPDDPDIVSIASFSDYYCPYCRVQTRRLADLAEERDSGVEVSWHELPILGEGSERAAKAALAAKRQGAYVAFQEALWTTPFRPTRGYLLRLSDSIGIDGQRLIDDMQSNEVVEEIMISKALARVFGFIGTPAMVIGGTVVQGEVNEGIFRQLVEIERDEGWTRIC